MQKNALRVASSALRTIIQTATSVGITPIFFRPVTAHAWRHGRDEDAMKLTRVVVQQGVCHVPVGSIALSIVQSVYTMPSLIVPMDLVNAGPTMESMII
jgi:hypothetical protein